MQMQRIFSRFGARARGDLAKRWVRTFSERGVKRCEDSQTWLSLVVKPTGLPNFSRASAGDILRWTDLVTGISAIQHAESAGAATLAFDRVSLSQPITAFDVVRFSAEVVSVGRTSMLVLCQGFRQDMHTQELTPVLKSYVTYVAMGKNGRPVQVRPSLES